MHDRPEHRTTPPQIDRIRISSVGQQEFHIVGQAALHGALQRSDSDMHEDVWVRAMGQQQLNHFFVVVRKQGQRQWRLAVGSLIRVAIEFLIEVTGSLHFRS